MSVQEVADKIKMGKIVPVFNHEDTETALRVLKACFDGGIRVFEWTHRSENAADIFLKLMAFSKKNFPSMLLGAGSIFDEDTARKYVSLGARFVVSPVLDPELRDTCRQLAVLWIPGAGTLTEIHQAQKWGADIVKIFPGDAVGGPGFVKAIRGPMPWAQIMPTGGVSPDKKNLDAWFEAGVCCVGMGSKLFTKELVNNPDPGPLVKKIQETLSYLIPTF